MRFEYSERKTNLMVCVECLIVFFLILQIVLFISISVFSANAQPPRPELRLEIIYQSKTEVGKEETLRVRLVNIGNDVAANITVGFDVPLGIFNITAIEREGPEILSPSEEMNITFKIIALRPGNFSIGPALVYFDLEGHEYQESWDPTINIEVKPASTSSLNSWILTILVIIIIVIGIAYFVRRKSRKPRSRNVRLHISPSYICLLRFSSFATIDAEMGMSLVWRP